MACKREDIKALLPDHAKGALKGDLDAEVESHLRTCSDCRKELTVLKMMADENIPDPGEAFWQTMPDRIRSAIERERVALAESRISGLPRILDRIIRPRWAWAVASTVLAAVVVWGVSANYQAGLRRSAPIEPEAFLEEDVYYNASIFEAFEDVSDFERLSAWADAGLKEISDQMTMVLNGSDTDVYEDIFGLSADEMKRLRTIIDGLKRGGMS